MFRKNVPVVWIVLLVRCENFSGLPVFTFQIGEIGVVARPSDLLESFLLLASVFFRQDFRKDLHPSKFNIVLSRVNRESGRALFLKRRKNESNTS